MSAVYDKADRCLFSDLRCLECAHCLGHKLPAEYEAVAE